MIIMMTLKTNMDYQEKNQHMYQFPLYRIRMKIEEKNGKTTKINHLILVREGKRHKITLMEILTVNDEYRQEEENDLVRALTSLVSLKKTIPILL